MTNQKSTSWAGTKEQYNALFDIDRANLEYGGSAPSTTTRYAWLAQDVTAWVKSEIILPGPRNWQSLVPALLSSQAEQLWKRNGFWFKGDLWDSEGHYNRSHHDWVMARTLVKRALKTLASSKLTAL